MTSHPPAPRSGRAPLVVSCLALLVALGGIGGPAIADAIASDSDKVDGFHAVGAKAKAGKRAGKLVATNSKGRLPRNIVDASLPEALPPGATMRGAWGIDDQDTTQTNNGSWGSTISFPVPVPEGMKLEVLGESEVSEECRGYAYAPTAAPGWVCVYTSIGDTTNNVVGQMSTVYGVNLWINDRAGEGVVFHTGTWAATAPR